ncbi:NAD-dependent protein deacylase [Facklamia miroungae]|uniref:protein acetyllysine N-acetyltransferase n=1 Tax=Facklamia miroungae TaxID=120956 RepID=A0A1G7TXG8_9LACT|nr:NAD-dependent protein deacylase [Facklamia miroungae]NKZ29987.1 NAD-dependent protein deacylase [Facklamia miroungae]SDG39220.1 NAD-dependent deacetylase [Facklamia miroungae]
MAEDQIRHFAQMIQESQNIVFFGGAGVSTGSGIPDFRSAQGIFMQDSNYEFSAEEIISHPFYQSHPKIFFDFYFDKLVYPEIEPNLSHTFLKDLEDKGKNVTIVTQNIDGLHQKAGSSQVLELHGSVLDNYCSQCGTYYSLKDLERDAQGIPRCPKDQAIIKPDVVLYGEMLDEETIRQSIQAISHADLLIIAGTSLNVYPAASFIHYFKGNDQVVINQTPIISNHPNALVFQEKIEQVFQSVKDLL